MKKIVAILISAILMLSALPPSVFAETSETPVVSSIEIEDIEIIEGTHGTTDDHCGYFYSDFSPKFTVTLSNGKILRGNNYITINNESCCLSFDASSQYEEPWTVGNTYQVTGTLMDVSDTFNVTIVESPVESIEIDDIEIIEGTHGYQNTDGIYYYNNIYPTYTVTLKDGTKLKSSAVHGVEIGGWYIGDVNVELSVQNENPWTVGNTYQVTGTLMGLSDTFNVTIVENPVESIAIDDFEIIEGTHGQINADGTYYYTTFYPNFTVTLKSGEILRNVYDYITINGETYSLSVNDYLQYENPWTAGNTYQVTGTFLGVSDTFNVTVAEAPIKTIKIDDIEITVGTHGYTREDGTFYYDYIYPSFTAVFKDKKTVKSSGSGMEIDGVRYSLEIDKSDQDEEPWTVGNTYQVVGTFLGVKDTFNVTIVESPVESVEINDIKIIEGTQDSSNGDFYYYDNIRPSFTVTLKNGEAIKSDGGISIDGEWYSLETNAYSLQQAKPWTLGNTYQVTGSLLGVSDTFNVKITENPVAAVEIADVEVIEETNGYANGDGYFYSIYPKFTVVMKDGRRIENIDGLEVDGRWYSLSNNAWIIQNSQPWTVGNTYSVTGKFMGVSTDFNVSIIESPVASVEISDIEIFEYTHGYEENGTFSYCYFNPSFTVTLKSGERVIAESDECIELNGKSYCLSCTTADQSANPWTAGNTYQVTGKILGVSDTFNVTVKEAPVESVEITDVTVIKDNCWNIQPSFTVTLKNGEKISSKIKYFGDDYWSRYVEIENEKYSPEIDLPNPDEWTAGETYSGTLSIMGVSGSFNVIVIENPVIAIKAEDAEIVEGTHGHEGENGVYYYDNYLNITLTLKDGSTVTNDNEFVEIYGQFYYIYNIESVWQYREPWTAGNTYSVTVELLDLSDTFNVTVKRAAATDIELISLPERLKYGENLDALDLTGGVVRITYANGKTQDINMSELEVVGFDNTRAGACELTVKYEGLSLKFTVKITERPISFAALSSAPEKQFYRQGEELELAGGKLAVGYRDGSYAVIDITEDMLSGYDANKLGEQVITVTYRGYTSKFTVEVYIQGDIDGDGAVNASDMAILRRYLLGGEEANEKYDVNGNGVIDIKDLVCLKKLSAGSEKSDSQSERTSPLSANIPSAEAPKRDFSI